LSVKIFISWSGERSKTVAKTLRNWLISVMPNAKPFMSDVDIALGTVGLDTINKALQGAEHGIVCLTPENMHNVWIHYEAGAIAKTVGAKVWTLLIGGLDIPQVKGPLSQFQLARSTDEALFRLVYEMHEASGNLVVEANLHRTFTLWWPELEKVFATLPPTPVTRVPNFGDQVKAAVILEGAKPQTNVLKRGHTYGLEYTIRAAENMPTLFWLGSSYLDATGHRHASQAHDKPINLINGVYPYRRDFTVPANSPLGDFKLGMNLWMGSPAPGMQSARIYGVENKIKIVA
jgi:hypothetical protein